MFAFFKSKKNKQKRPKQPYITFYLIDDADISAEVGWDENMNPIQFSELLKCINEGYLIPLQSEVIKIYSQNNNESEKVKYIHAQLITMAEKLIDNVDSNKGPLVRPSEAISKYIKNYMT